MISLLCLSDFLLNNSDLNQFKIGVIMKLFPNLIQIEFDYQYRDKLSFNFIGFLLDAIIRNKEKTEQMLMIKCSQIRDKLWDNALFEKYAKKCEKYKMKIEKEKHEWNNSDFNIIIKINNK